MRDYAGIPAQLFGTEMLLDVAKTAVGRRMIVSQGALSGLCDGMADGRIKVLRALGTHFTPAVSCCTARKLVPSPGEASLLMCRARHLQMA